MPKRIYIAGMTETLTDTLRRLYTDPGDYIDAEHPDVIAFAAKHAGTDDRETASKLYAAVRDGIRYQPYVDMADEETFRASSVLAAGYGYCVGKASLYAAACRARGVPARVGFADVTNHLTTPKLTERMGTDLFAWHGFAEVFVDGAWRKATPTFNATLCEKIGVAPLDFDGHNDALLHEFDGSGRAYMRYETIHGTFHDVPVPFLQREMARLYPAMVGKDHTRHDMNHDLEREAAEDAA